MIGRTTQISEPAALWAARASVFALFLVALAFALHRLSMMTTPVAMNLFGVGYLFAALGFSLGLYAATSIWIRGRSGAWNTAWGLLFALLLWLWPAALAPTYFGLPRINDITTDTANPPTFVTLARVRPVGANGVAYQKAYAPQQAKAYPDLHTLVIPRSAEEVYEITLDLVRGRRGLGWKVVAEEAPQPRQNRAGIIEANDRTLIMGFTDDVVIRIVGTDSEARVDIRSASRYGHTDLGANASRIRRFVHELSARLDAAGPVGVAARGVRINRAELPARRPLERTPAKEDRKR